MKQNEYAKRVGVVIAACLILPPIVFWTLFSRTPSISPVKAMHLLKTSPNVTILVDVRSKTEYDRFHLLESVHVPYEEIAENCAEGLHQLLGEKQYVFLICNSGVLSAMATARLIRAGIPALNVEGGLDA